LERAYDASRNQLLERVKTRIAHAEPLMAAAIKVPASS
jgi:glycerol-3-phosphate acyltransferase PlsX